MVWILSHKVYLFFFFFLFATVSGAQNKVTIKYHIDRDSILIGEQIHFILEADFPLQEPMSFFTIDSIPHFEILDRKKIDTLDNNKEIRLTQTLTLTSFDSGRWVIPSFELPGDRPLFTDSLPVDVRFSPFDPNQDYHGIKDIIEVHAEQKKEQHSYWYIAISAVLVAAIIYFLLRKSKKPVGKLPPVDAYTEAKQELEKLKKENPDPKQYYTRLVDIFRLYISKRKNIASLQETTDDLVWQLKKLSLPADDFEKLSQALRMSDFVKFAKYEAGEKDKTESFMIIKHVIEALEKTIRTDVRNTH